MLIQNYKQNTDQLENNNKIFMDSEIEENSNKIADLKMINNQNKFEFDLIN